MVEKGHNGSRRFKKLQEDSRRFQEVSRIKGTRRYNKAQEGSGMLKKAQECSRMSKEKGFKKFNRFLPWLGSK